MTRIAVVDYGAGNLVSIEQALVRVGASVTIARDAAALRNAEAIVVPGVGAAAPAMARLERHGLLGPLRGWLEADRPFLGICLGLQLLFESSDEDGAATLGVLRGRAVRLDDAPTLPHIGWNQVELVRTDPLFEGIASGTDLYFVHSFAGRPLHEDVVLARTVHGRPFVSAVRSGHRWGVQFHPERSGEDGLRLLANFVGIVRGSLDVIGPTAAGASA
jgi:imidazole glycerol phosphate synthase glutamine amidotransferase subunit